MYAADWLSLMPVFRKQILAPGTYVTRSGPVTITKADCADFVTTGRAMLDSNVQIPVPMEHQSDAKPTVVEQLSHLVGFNTGFVRKFDLDKDGAAWTDLEINSIPIIADGKVNLLTEPDKVKHFVENNVRYVSPELLPSYRDGKGNVWNNVVSHVALTPIPVWHDQLPFGSEAPLAMSLGHDTYSWRKRPTVRLSLADMWCTTGCAKELGDVSVKLSQAVAPAGGTVIGGVFFRGGSPLTPKISEQLNMSKEYQPKTGAKCTCRPGVQRDNCPNCEGTGWVIDFAKIRNKSSAGSMLPVDSGKTQAGKGKLSMADDTDILGDGGKPGDMPPAPSGDMPPAAAKGGKSKELIDQIREIAGEIGIDLSDSISNPTEALEHLVTALKTHKKTKALADGGKPADKPGDDTPHEEPQVVAMSQAQLKELEDLKKQLADQKAEAAAQLSLLKQHNEEANGRAADAELRTLLSAIDGWVKDGYVAPDRWNKHKDVLATKKLSLISGNDMEVNNILDRAKVVAEMIRDGELKKGNMFPAGQTTEPERPDYAQFSLQPGGNMTPDKVKGVLAEIDGLLGRQQK